MANGIYEGNDKPNTKAGDFFEMYGKGDDDKLESWNPYWFSLTEIYGGGGDDKLYFSTDAFYGLAQGTMEGGSGNDKLFAGWYADALYGGKGDDTIQANDGADLVYGQKGDDTIYGNVKNQNGPDFGDAIYGGSGNDRIYGQNGSDLINGGKGTDKLTGNSGLNNFVFDTSLSSSNVDTITDFSVFDDLIYLDDDVFDVGPAGFFLDPDMFHKGKHANNSDVRIVYNKNNGELLYTPDGNDSSEEILFAKLDKNLSVDWDNFFVVS